MITNSFQPTIEWNNNINQQAHKGVGWRPIETAIGRRDTQMCQFASTVRVNSQLVWALSSSKKKKRKHESPQPSTSQSPKSSQSVEKQTQPESTNL